MKESLRLANQIANNNDNPKLWIANYNKLWSTITDGSTQWQSTSKLRRISTKLQRSFQDFWSDQMNHEQRMRTYKLFKCSLVTEDYLNLKTQNLEEPWQI